MFVISKVAKDGGVGKRKNIEQAVEAAERVLDKEPTDFSFAPSNIVEARAAVQRLGQGFEEIPNAYKSAFKAGRSSGTQISEDRLQGLAEIVQNADDARASEVRFMLRANELLATHNGRPVQLEDVFALATPWDTTKTGDASAIGRYGIGLLTLQSLSPTLEVHSAPFHIQIGDLTVESIDPPDVPNRFREPGWTTIRIPLSAGSLQLTKLETWLEHWDDSSLLFLRHVTRVALLKPDGDAIRTLTLSRSPDKDLELGPESPTISRELATASDERKWVVYTADVSAPADLSREQKATEPTTPIAVAFPLDPTEKGQIYAGLPVAPIPMPLFASAQFDTTTSRAGFAATDWNDAVVDLVAYVWSEAVLDFFEREPETAWQAIPLPRNQQGESESPVIRAIEAGVAGKARQEVASKLSFPVPGQGHINLSQLAVEERQLEGILKLAEIAQLAGRPATLPIGVRDPGGKWRQVLNDWRRHGADLPEPVIVEQALELLSNTTRPIDSTISLVAVALKEKLGDSLLKLPCVIAHDGRRLVPPSKPSIKAVSTETSTLAEQLGISTQLHQAHLGDANGAPEVLEWLRGCGALLEASNDGEVVRRIARAGRSAFSMDSQLSDEQVRALGDAFERIGKDDGRELGPDVGKAILLESYAYDSEGKKKALTTRPADAYLPGAIDRESDSFAVAAGKAEGLVWLSDRYARTLRSEAGREGIGALSFLRLLGAEASPRLQPHAKQAMRYAKWSNRTDTRPGLPMRVADGSEARILAMSQLGATYTLDDRDSPDLLAVIIDISKEHDAQQRRIRAGALLAALRRAWGSLRDFALVDAAIDDRRWRVKQQINAFWLWQAQDFAWLDDEQGTARRPVELRLRTQGTEAIYGKDHRNYLHPDFDKSIHLAILTELGISEGPSRTDLVKRLQELKQVSSAAEVSTEDLQHDTALVYRALASDLKSGKNDPDLTTQQLLWEFASDHLVFTDLGWRSPRQVLTGDPIFGRLRAFSPGAKECKPLWEALQMREPSPNDCLQVLKEVAGNCDHTPDSDEEAILLETLNGLLKHHVEGTTISGREAEQLPLWTSKGWTQERPVYATDDPALADGLGDRLPIWIPPSGLEKFRPLLELLRVTEIQNDLTRVINPELAQKDSILTEFSEELSKFCVTIFNVTTKSLPEASRCNGNY